MMNKTNCTVKNPFSLYKFHCFMELLKIMKFRQPISLQELFLPTRMINSEGMIIPRVRLEKS